ncbi:hypothetical protein [Pseudoalteromonas sp. DY56-GL79]|uniref:hypothetical protein n=1 Tax=Pseudoalteromonas sp. DY56-GL79 TaxID=2967131 RepID=UPI00352B5DE5
MSKLQSELKKFSSPSKNKKINLLKKELLELVSSSAGGGAFYKNHTKYVKPDEVPKTLKP